MEATGWGGAINVVTRDDECDFVFATEELASFGTNKASILGARMFKKAGVQVQLGYFQNKADNNYTMTYPVFETNLPASAYQQVRRENDYYQSAMYFLSIVARKLWFDKIELELALYHNKKGIQELEFNSQSAHTRGTNFMPCLTLEKKDFFIKNLEFKMHMVCPIIHTHLIDTARVKKQWNGEVIPAMGETADNLRNYSDDRQVEVRNRVNLKYQFKQHTLNLNNQFTYSKYRPKDDYTIGYIGFDPSAFPSNLTANVLGLTHEYNTRDNRFHNSFAVSLYALHSQIYGTNEGFIVESGSAKKAPKETKVENFYYGISEGFSYEFFKGIRGKLSVSHNVRLPDTGELFGDGTTIKPSVNLQPEASNNLNLGLLMDKNDFMGMNRFQLEANLYYMYITNMISLFPADIRMIYINLGKTETKGLDLDLKMDFTPQFYGYFNLTCQAIKDKLKWITDDKRVSNPTYNKDVPNIPQMYFNYGIEYHKEGLLGKKEYSRAYLDASYINEFNWSWQLSDLPEQRKKWSIPKSHIFTAGLQQSFWKNKISLGFEVENIFNQQSFMEFKKPLQGRTFKIKLRLNWFGDETSGGAMSL